MSKMTIVIIFFLSLGYSAVVQPDWTSLINKRVKFQMKDSGVFAGKVLYCRDSLITLLTNQGTMSIIEIRDVASFSEIKISYGPEFGLNFGSAGFNVDVCNLNIFAYTSVLLPVLSKGHVFTLSTGVGKLVNLGAGNWKWNLFASISSVITDAFFDWGAVSSAGAGVGFQYTGNNRFLCSFKIPVFGYYFYTYAGNKKLVFIYPETFRDNLLAFYACNLLSLPIFAFGANF